MWQQSFGQRKIISEFMKDRSLGEKRLASMPDRVTNTINLVGGKGVANRPTVINCFGGDMTSSAKWWSAWKAFMFEQQVTVEGGGGGGGGVTTVPAKMLQKIRRSKYPAVTAEEEAISIPLQTLAQQLASKCAWTSGLTAPRRPNCRFQGPRARAYNPERRFSRLSAAHQSAREGASGRN